MELGTLDNAKKYVLEKEIESVLRKSHAEQFSWMESKFSLPLRQGLEIWPKFIEITERRNLYVHTGGIVSSQYLKICKENGLLLPNTKVGDEISIEPDYFRHAYNIISRSRKRPTRLKLNDIGYIPQVYNGTTEQESDTA